MAPSTLPVRHPPSPWLELAGFTTLTARTASFRCRPASRPPRRTGSTLATFWGSRPGPPPATAPTIQATKRVSRRRQLRRRSGLRLRGATARQRPICSASTRTAWASSRCGGHHGGDRRSQHPKAPLTVHDLDTAFFGLFVETDAEAAVRRVCQNCRGAALHLE